MQTKYYARRKPGLDRNETTGDRRAKNYVLNIAKNSIFAALYGAVAQLVRAQDS